jgi:hypothetical protein
MKLTNSNYFDLFWVVFMGGIFLTAFGYNREAGLIPMLVAGPCTIMSIYTFVTGVMQKKEKGVSAEDDLVKGIMEKMEGVSMDQVAFKKKKEKVDPKVRRKRFWIWIAWMFGFSLTVFLVGHLVAIPIFMLLYMLANKEKWYIALGSAVMVTLIVYFAFVVATQSTLYGGVVYEHFFPVD